MQATYTTQAARDTAYSAVQSVISTYSGSATARAGRFSAGLTQPNTTSFTASYEVATEANATALAESLKVAGTANRSAVLLSVYRGNTP